MATNQSTVSAKLVKSPLLQLLVVWGIIGRSAAAADNVDTGVDAEEQQGEEDETEHGTDSNDVDEFNQRDLTGGVDAITDEDLFVQTRDEDV